MDLKAAWPSHCNLSVLAIPQERLIKSRDHPDDNDPKLEQGIQRVERFSKKRS